MSNDLVALHLESAWPSAGAPIDADGGVIRRVLDESFRTLADVLSAADPAAAADVVAAASRCRTELAAGTPAHMLDPLARSCFESALTVGARARSQAAEQRAQVASLVATVQDIVASMVGDQASVQATLAGSAERFEHLAKIDDVRQIQAQLVEEVTTLKRITLERRATWEQTSQEFATRLATLEAQLDSTRLEASLDPLTNVANRRAFERTCLQWMAPARPGFVMAMADVDNFKEINDEFGHFVGDQVLVTVAEALVRALRSGDLVARVGGDEFAILAASLTLGQAEGRFAGIAGAVQRACQGLVPEGTTAPTISIGIAERSAGDTVESLQQRTDAALYQAKKNGKGRLASKASPFIRDLRANGKHQ